MATKSRRRHGAKSSATTTIKKSLRDAQAVFASYFESGGKRVKETFDALTDIFEKRHFDSALRAAGVRATAPARTGSRRRASAARAKPSPRRTGTAAKRSSPARPTKRGTQTRRKSS
jgi:hypothetical protein